MHPDHHASLQIHQSRLQSLAPLYPALQHPAFPSATPHVMSLYAAPPPTSTASFPAPHVHLAQSHFHMLLCLCATARFLTFALAPYTPTLSHKRPRQVIMMRLTSTAAVQRFYNLERDARRVAPWMAADYFEQIDADDAATFEDESRCACCLQ
jgi:hypothetical protein